MDLELKKIYDSLSTYCAIDGINEIRRDMDMLNDKLTEYKGMARLNSYNIPSIICEIDKLNESIEGKYSNYFDKFKNKNYNVNVFGFGSDSFEQKIENSLNMLGKVAVSKICSHYGVNLPVAELNTSNSELFRLYNSSIEKFDVNHVDDDTNFGFKIMY